MKCRYCRFRRISAFYKRSIFEAAQRFGALAKNICLCDEIPVASQVKFSTFESIIVDEKNTSVNNTFGFNGLRCQEKACKR